MPTPHETHQQGGAPKWMTVVELGVDLADDTNVGDPIDISGYSKISMELVLESGDHTAHVVSLDVSNDLSFWESRDLTTAALAGIEETETFAKYCRWSISIENVLASTGEIHFHCKV